MDNGTDAYRCIISVIFMNRGTKGLLTPHTR